MKKLVLILSIFSIFAFPIIAQDATITIPDMTAQSDTEVLVPLNITTLNNVGSSSLQVQYDPLVLTYIGIENDSFGGVIENADGGVVRTSWFSLSAVNLSGKVFDIRFQYHGGSSDLTIILAQMTDDLVQPYDIATVDGSIAESAGATISLTSPVGGEEWMAGTVQNITWMSSGVTNVKIEYSTDNGTGWNDVVVSTPNTGTYAWTVPATATSAALVFVSDAADIDVNDESAANFTIVTPPVVGDIPDQTIMEGESFVKIKLDDYVTDDDNDVSEMVWTTSGEVELTVTISNNRDATINIPGGGWSGTETISFTATDPNGGFDSDAAVFKVIMAQGPVVGDIPDQTINEGESFTAINLDDYVSDPDNDPSEMTWVAAGQIELTVSIVNRVATINIPDELWNGSETISFTATDPGGLSDNDNAVFTVNAVNQPPVVAGIPDKTIAGDESFVSIELDNYVSDPDNEPSEMTWAATGQSELTVSILNRVATISIPNNEWLGSETITFTATDPGGLSDSDDSVIDKQVVIGVDDELEIPEEFALNQNYPNPFNPSTSISYALKVNSEVTLRVYNMVGQEVATLVNETKNAGTYNLIFDAADMTTGVYFYAISVIGIDGSKFINTKKMILMK